MTAAVSPEMGLRDYWVDAPDSFPIKHPRDPELSDDQLYLKNGYLTLHTEYRSIDLHLTFKNARSALAAMQRCVDSGRPQRLWEVEGRLITAELDEDDSIVLRTPAMKRVVLMRLHELELHEVRTWFRAVEARRTAETEVPEE